MEYTQIYLTGDVAILDMAFPIEEFSNGKGGYYTPNQRAHTDTTFQPRKTVDGKLFVIGLDLNYPEEEIIALSNALGTNIEYSFIGLKAMKKLIKFPEWNEGYDEGKEPKADIKPPDKNKKEFFMDRLKARKSLKRIPEGKTYKRY